MPLLILILLVGYIIFYPAESVRNPIAISDFLKPTVMSVEVVSLVKHQKCYEAFTVKPLNQSYYFQASWFSCQLIDVHVGDILEVSFKLKPLHAMNNPGGFDAMQWARQNNIVAQATIKSAKKIGEAKGLSVALERLREHLDEITRLSEKEKCQFRNKYLGFIYQFHHLLPEFTILDNVSMPLWIGNVHKKEAKQRSLEILERVGLAARVHHRMSELSGGERQRAAIARAGYATFLRACRRTHGEFR